MEMFTQIVERQELQRVIDTLPDDSVVAILDLIRSLRLPKTQLDDDDGFYDEANVRWIKGSIEQLNQGKVVVKTIEELERMADE
jgi:hypothetical protein